uniref:Uncharacterized protein n=1 Tax=Magallana gigas TaxID=29159 RepID=A0A8W8LDX1_MAGGI
MDTVLFCLCLISGQYILSASASRIRLVNGHGAPNQGRLEVYDNMLGVWGTVCDDLFDRNAAGVVCEQLGYSRLNAQVRTQAFFGPGRGRIAYDDVKCSGSETDLSQCSHAMISDCTHAEDVGVICQNTSTNANCNFEQSGCPWVNIRGENFDWMVHTGSTPSSGTGPVTDHTLGTSSGFYKMVYL